MRSSRLKILVRSREHVGRGRNQRRNRMPRKVMCNEKRKEVRAKILE